jgi:F-type H+-transporting ATPase subunit alpha
MDDVPVKQVLPFEKQFIEYMDRGHSEILKTIQTTGVIDDATEEKLKQAIESFKKIFADEINNE